MVHGQLCVAFQIIHELKIRQHTLVVGTEKYVLIFQVEGARCNVIFLCQQADQTFCEMEMKHRCMLVALDDIAFCKELLGDGC